MATIPSPSYDRSATWDELRRHSRRLEGDLDVHLSSYAKLDGHLNWRSAVGNEALWKSMEREIEALLARLTDVNEALIRCAAASPSFPTVSVVEKLARHRDVLREFTQEFKRTKGNIMSVREHAQLLTSTYKTSISNQYVLNLLRGRGPSHSEEVTCQLETMKAVLAAQKYTFRQIQGKVKHLCEKLQVLQIVLGAIKWKRLKDSVVLSAVTAGCTLFLIIYWIAK